jgi:hypothetical protein
MLALGAFLTAGMTSVMAQQGSTSAKTRNLVETAGSKQTSKDFKPGPDEIKANFGTLKF